MREKTKPGASRSAGSRSRFARMKAITCALLLAACGHHEEQAAGGKGADVPDPAPANSARIDVTVVGLAANAEIPTENTCEGADTSPALAWSGAPGVTKSFALIVDDPDAPDPAKPRQTWVHWVLAQIPPSVSTIGAGQTPDGAIVGKNDWGKTAWGGPCPPIGRHRYFFKLYALDAEVGRPGMTKPELLTAMKGHVLARGEVVATYQKKKT
jgi:Raf kinase inhibitor-like YbhB/YbcL family protein